MKVHDERRLKGRGFALVLIVSSLVLLVAAVNGCRSLGGYGLGAISFPFGKPERPPRFVVRYFPYGPSLDRRFFAPVPDYSMWTDSRMRKDLSRMGECGVTFVSVVVDKDVFRMHGKRERFERFVIEASRPGAAAPRVVFELDGALARDPDMFQEFQTWMLERKVYSLPGYARGDDGRPLILLDEVGSPALRHPALAYIALGADGAWAWGHPAPEELRQRTARAFVVPVCAGLLGGKDGKGRLEWIIPRRRGRTLRAGLRAATDLGAQWILISSWNDYAHGDGIEPNTLDGDAVLQAMAGETRYIRSLFVSAAPSAR